MMFTATVRELQVLGASTQEALRIANEIDFTRSKGTAIEIATQSWEEELEGLARIQEERDYNNAQEILLDGERNT